jgi:hypothetical protein
MNCIWDAASCTLYKITDVSEVLTTSIIRAISSRPVERIHRVSFENGNSQKLHPFQIKQNVTMDTVYTEVTLTWAVFIQNGVLIHSHTSNIF